MVERSCREISVLILDLCCFLHDNSRKLARPFCYFHQCPVMMAAGEGDGWGGGGRGSCFIKNKKYAASNIQTNVIGILDFSDGVFFFKYADLCSG